MTPDRRNLLRLANSGSAVSRYVFQIQIIDKQDGVCNSRYEMLSDEPGRLH